MKKLFHVTIIAVVFFASFHSLGFGQNLSIEAKTETYGGINTGGDPEDNVAVIYIMTPDSQFINTCMVWGETGFDFMLKNWRIISGIGQAGYYDGVTQATRDDHSDPLVALWDCKDTAGNQVTAGTYDYWIEMNEHDWWWQELDPNEVYNGRITKGTIEIDFVKEIYDTGTAIESIFDIYAHFDPTTKITFKASSDQSNAVSFTYNPVSRLLIMKLGPLSSYAGMVHIYDVQGTTLKTISFNPNTQRICWDGTNTAGYPMPSGVYIFEIKTTDTPKKSFVHTATLYK